MAGDSMRINGKAKHAKAVSKVRFPYRLVPLDMGGTKHVVDEDVETALLSFDPSDERADLLGLEMVDGNGDAAAARAVDQFRRLLDRFRAIHFRTRCSRRAPGHVNGCAGGAELNRDA